MFFLSCVCYAFVSVWLYLPCDHLLGKCWPLGSHLWCPTVSLLLSHWYPGSDVVLDCIDSWSLHPYLLLHTVQSLKITTNSIETSSFWFTRNLRLREYFAAKAFDENDDEPDTHDNHYEYVKRNTDSKSTFVPPSGRDTSLDCYIDSITNEIIQTKK